MNPTLREPEIMAVMPYGGNPLCVGDVVFFLPPGSDQPVVHRIIRITPAGISTRGDNSSRDDDFNVQPENIKGRVTAAWHGHQKRRKIAGGLQGRLTCRWLRLRRLIDREVSPLLHPVYRFIAHSGFIVWILPASLRPRIVIFKTRDGDQLQLLLGQRNIGQYDNQMQQWQIQRPFRLFVDVKMISGQQEKGHNANFK